MDPSLLFTYTISQLLSHFWWLIPVFIIAALPKLPVIKGFLGEMKVNLATKFFLNKNDYTLFKNITLQTEDDSTQIDHVIVSRYGVFVIETKNMKGWIFGSPQQKTWTQKIHRHTYNFQNPLHQNYKHMQTLQSVLQLDQEKVFSLVVFVGNSEFKSPMPYNVVDVGGFIHFIKNKRQPILSDRETQTICAKIQSSRVSPSLKTHNHHVKHVQSIVANKRHYTSNTSRKTGSPMKIIVNTSIGLVFSVALAYFGHQLFMKNVLGGIGEISQRQMERAKQNKLKQKPIKSAEQQRQRLLAEEIEMQRNKTATLAWQKKQAWMEWYQSKQPKGCDNWTSERHMVECANHTIRAKRDFEKLWQTGEFKHSG